MRAAIESPALPMLSKNSGYLASFLVHGSIVALCAAASALVAVDRPPVAPGENTGGGDVSVVLDYPGGSADASGSASASRIAGDVTMRPVSRLNADRLLEEINRRDREATNSAQARPVPSSPVAVSKPAIRSETAAGRSDRSRPTGIVGVQVDGPSGGSSSARGRPGDGTRIGSTPGDGATGAVFAAMVREAFAARFVPLFREQGGELSAGRDAGEVKLRVAPNGAVSFAGWSVAPAEPLTQRLVRESVSAMGAVEAPPGGETVVVVIPVSGSVDG